MRQQQEEEFTQCRIDHYQTPTEVHASIFAKKADPDTSTIRIEESEVGIHNTSPLQCSAHFPCQVFVDLYLPASKRFRKTLQLWGPVNVAESSYKFYGTKVRIHDSKSGIEL